MARTVRSPLCAPHAPRSPFRAPPSAAAHALTCPRASFPATRPHLRPWSAAGLRDGPPRDRPPAPSRSLFVSTRVSAPRSSVSPAGPSALPPFPGLDVLRTRERTRPIHTALGHAVWRRKRWPRGRSCRVSPRLGPEDTVSSRRARAPHADCAGSPTAAVLLSRRPLPASEPTRAPGPRRVCSTPARGRRAGPRRPSAGPGDANAACVLPDTRGRHSRWFPRPQRRRRLLPTELGRPEPREAGGWTWKSELRRSTFT